MNGNQFSHLVVHLLYQMLRPVSVERPRMSHRLPVYIIIHQLWSQFIIVSYHLPEESPVGQAAKSKGVGIV